MDEKSDVVANVTLYYVHIAHMARRDNIVTKLPVVEDGSDQNAHTV